MNASPLYSLNFKNQGNYHRLAFHVVDTEAAAAAKAAGAPVEQGPEGTADICIETTRPELLPACVALVTRKR